MPEISLSVRSMDEFFEDAHRLARALDRGEEVPSHAEISFENPDQLFDVMTGNRWRLLQILRASGPSSIRALAAKLGRDYRGVHADVSRFLELGLIEKDEAARIHVPWSRITASLALEDAA